jgi:hypothetical protein
MLMDDWPSNDLAALAPEVNLDAARRGFDQRRRRRQRRARGALAGSAVAVVLVGIGAVALVADERNDPRTVTDAPTDPTSPATSPPATSAPATSPATTLRTVDTATVAPAPPADALELRPFGVSSDDPALIVSEHAISVQPDDGGLELTYELQMLFNMAGRSGVIDIANATTDAQLSIEVSCEVADCRFEPRSDVFQIPLMLTVRTSDATLTTGVHTAPSTIRFDDGTTTEFDLQFYSQPAPSADIAREVAAATGEPTIVQQVFDVGRFPYHAITAFESVWVLAQASGQVARIDATTGALLATIPLGPSEPRISSNRLTAGDNYIYAAGRPVVRIDPTDNTSTVIDGGFRASGVVADGDTVWAVGRDGLQRVDPDGTITDLNVPQDSWSDLGWSDGLVWAISTQRGAGTLLAIDGYSGEIRYDIELELDDNEVAVRIVADDNSVVVGTDTSGGGGRTGRLLVFDPTTGDLLDQAVLNTRPEGIVLTPEHIWTSGAIVDRATLTVEVDNAGFGFSITRGPDGSIWGTGAAPASGVNDGVALRWTPGDYDD